MNVVIILLVILVIQMLVLILINKAILKELMFDLPEAIRKKFPTAGERELARHGKWVWQKMEENELRKRKEKEEEDKDN